MENFKPNSNKYREEMKNEVAERRAHKVVKAPANIKKKNELQRMTDTFVHEDWSKVKEYAIHDVIFPGIKDAIWNIITNTLDMFLFGGDGRAKRYSSPGARVNMTNYNAISNRRHTSNTTVNDTRNNDIKRVADYGNIEVATRAEAEAILVQLDEIMAAYKMVRVADLYDAAGITQMDTQAQKYGWTDISSAKTVRSYNGRYAICLPRPLPID